MSTGKREDPILGYNFQVSLLDTSSSFAGVVVSLTLSAVLPRPIAGFNECTGLEMSLDVQEFMEGGNNGTVLKFPTRVKPGNLTLKKGLTSNPDLWNWFYDFVSGRGRRRDGLITVQDSAHRPHTVWGFRRGLPAKYSGPQLNAAQNAVAIESIEIAHEGLYQVSGATSFSEAVSEAAGAIADLFG
jgi:phage tail-like protein